MEFSAMTLNMFFPDYQSPDHDHETIVLATKQSIWLAGLGFNPWYTDHHFRGPWHSNPIQFASYIAPQISPERYIGFGVLSAPFYHPVRLVESMNLLDQLTRGKTLFGLGSGWQGTEAEALGIEKDYHASGHAAEDTLDVMQKLWTFRTGDPAYSFEVGGNRGTIKRRVMPAPYGKRHPVIIRTASREAGLLKAAKHGWPAFLGIFGGDVRGQARQYRIALAAANHPQEVVEECLRWCTADWLSVVVAQTDAEAKERAQEAIAERMDIRRRYIAVHGKLDGPVIRPTPGQSLADGFAAGGDMKDILAGSPDTVAAKVREIADLGINHLMVRFLGEYAGKTRHICEMSAELFANNIAPQFTDIPPLRDPLSIELGELV